MKIENKEFWEIDSVIATQEVLKKSSAFEIFMFENAKKRYSSFGDIKTIKIFACGTGREIESIAEFYNPNKIIASDLSENMIKKCNENLKTWKIDSITETLVINAKDYDFETNKFDLVTILNSMLAYVPLKSDRLRIFKNAYQILKPNATIIGTVHNQIGTPTKTFYFKLRNLFSFILGDKVGNRKTGFNGYKVSGYYYNKQGLYDELLLSGFETIEIYSLEEYYKLVGLNYNRKKGYNNLIFIASKKE